MAYRLWISPPKENKTSRDSLRTTYQKRKTMHGVTPYSSKSVKDNLKRKVIGGREYFSWKRCNAYRKKSDAEHHFVTNNYRNRGYSIRIIKITHKKRGARR